MITDPEERAAATMRRLYAFLREPDDDLAALEDVPVPTDDEAQAIVAELGIDVAALAARILAHVDEVIAAGAPPAPAPPSRRR